MAEELKQEMEQPQQWKRKSREEMAEETRTKALEDWKPKTTLGMKVKNGKIKNIDEIICIFAISLISDLK